jgi:TolA-binding protein
VRPQIVPRKNAAPLPNDGIDSLAEQTVSDEQKAKLTALRDKLSDLIKAKAELINEQTLTNEITTIEKQISDLHAAQKLLNAQQILKQLIEEFPQSPAAQKGQRMLDAAGVPKLSTSKLEPIPEPQRVSAIEPF